MKIDMNNRLVQLLQKRPGERFTARELAILFVENYPDDCEKKMEASSGLNNRDDLIAQITAEVGARRPRIQKRFPAVRITDERPRRYYYSESGESEQPVQGIAPSVSDETSCDDVYQLGGRKFYEQDFYPLLSSYLWTELGVYSKRIDEKRSDHTRGPKGNQWLFPDVVGMEFLADGWKRPVVDCATHHYDKLARLWSFEVKVRLRRGNVRQCFFQAVSNSSWANLGYLVAATIDKDETDKELRILSAAFGIGVIRLNVENPSESEIIYPAQERPAIEWGIVNRLVEANKDFEDYVEHVTQLYQTKKPHESDWDGPREEP
ncbi:MAG TPA: HrgA protein [Myxococcota bacterium]|nr:HrgA protein [Myxococcota bacterium]